MLLVRDIARNALLEDLGSGDITTEVLFGAEAGREVTGSFLAKADGVLAGLLVAKEVFAQLAPEARWAIRIEDGEPVAAGKEIARVTCPIAAALGAERVALNFMQRLSGVATATARLVAAVEGLPVRVVDTRKTTPGLRALEKWAVRMGGGRNHRFGLADAVLIKDNHIAACGSIAEAVGRARRAVPHTVTIEVEAENEAMVREALAAGADIIMLDNMATPAMADMVRLIGGRAIVEASGNIDESTIRAVAAAGVDVISCGAITHSAKALDISLNLV